MKLRHTILLLVLLPVISFAQHNSAGIKMGKFTPSATEGGFIIGYEGSRFVDRNLAIGWSIDWFHKKYIDQTLVQQFNNYYGVSSGEINELRAQSNLHSIPLMLSITANVPMFPRISAYLTGAFGAEVLLIFYKEFQNPDEGAFESAFDVSWRAGVGALYEIGNRSDLFFELDYHSSKPSWTYEVRDPVTQEKQTYERVFDMSGVMGRFGVRFYW
jgi:hypothetical protein